MKKAGPRMEEKGEVVGGAIEVGSEEDGSLRRVRLEVSWEARFKVSLDSSVEGMGRSRSRSRVSSSWSSSGSGEDSTGWGLLQQESGQGVQWDHWSEELNLLLCLAQVETSVDLAQSKVQVTQDFW